MEVPLDLLMRQFKNGGTGNDHPEFAVHRAKTREKWGIWASKRTLRLSGAERSVILLTSQCSGPTYRG
jgi:hypothetical protein